MSEERQNNNTGWTARLNELDALPGESINQSASWEKLHGRLDKKKKKVIPYWYWLAAACIIVLFFVPFFSNHKQETGLVKEEIKKKPVRPLKYSASPNKLTDTTTSPAIIAVVKQKKMKKRSNYVPQNSLINKEEAVIVPADKMILNEYPDTTSKISPVVVSAPKKLRVIHINELSHPVGEKQIMVRNNEGVNANCKAIYRENYSRMQLSNNTTDNILKINLSPTN